MPHILRAFGCQPVPETEADGMVVNPDRCLLVIGSLLTQSDLAARPHPVDVWGCGWKGKRVAPSDPQRYRCFAVRGPLTAAGLNLPRGIPLGDPALLLPEFWPERPAEHEATVVLPHLSRVAVGTASARRLATGADLVLSPLVIRDARARSLRARKESWRRSLRAMRTGLHLTDVAGAVAFVGGASFVLTGSLHGAILAQAYGVPWACYYDGCLDAPAKWLDWAAYLGIRVEAVQTIADGRTWWQNEGRRGRIRDLSPLRQAFPYVGEAAGAIP